MASATRSAIISGARTITMTTRSNLISKTLSPKSLPIPPFHSSIPRSPSRFVAALGTVDSLLPLHSAVASARLISSIGVDSTSWTWLSQGFASSL
ncbi:hypothetical protein M8C21_012870 [Ambrosia artemisiifolia]|uniref:Protein NUCLEAR FUSION DEFECTIVE 6, chloroplastic/mitochondrial n=1 Tax=Ambrosia artemisiifolia TaxID=4212 RepID=A0AAD5CTQ9_AMBAR|nr:hypothetical protein M8C21_012870 [Ambrosia artemisiifolia]